TLGSCFTFRQTLPPSSETNRPDSVPANSRSRALDDSRMTCSGLSGGRLFAIDTHVSPKSVVRNRYGLRSSLRCRSSVRYAGPSPNWEHSMRVIHRSLGTPFTLSLRSVHVLPSSLLTWMRPSSVPTHSRPAFSGDSVMVVIVFAQLGEPALPSV